MLIKVETVKSHSPRKGGYKKMQPTAFWFWLEPATFKIVIENYAQRI